jgi:HIP---CoA ligase
MPFETIPAVLDHAANEWSDAIAMEDGSTVLTFAQLRRQAHTAARALIANGLAPGDRVAIWAPNVWEWVVAALGIHCCGGVLVTLNTRYKGHEAADILQRSGSRWLFTVDGFLGHDYPALLEGHDLGGLERVVRMRHPEWDAFIAESDPVAALPEVSHGDLSDLLFTSGTTGHPKGVMTCHGQNVRAFTSWATVIGLRHGDRYLVVNPFFHAFGYKAGWLACLLTGATCLPHPVFDPVQVLARIAPDRVSMLPGPPALFQRLLAHPDRGQHDLSSLRLAVTGAAVIPVELIERMRQELGFDTVITGYGLTEACGIATMCRHDDDPVTIANTSGRAIDGVEVVVVVGGKEVPRGEAGEVLVRGYNVMRGYFEDPEATATSLDADGYLHTGDIGVMDERGYLRITDRAKDMFIMGGFNCYPAEIERLMLLDPSLAQVAVIGVPDERMGEVGMAFVVPAGGASIDEADVLAGCKERMANFKVPRHLRVVDALPMNATGKVQKFKLREWV